LLRYSIAESVTSQYLAVFLINQLGVLFAGLVIFKFKSTDSQRLFWIAGFSGGFTTFSSFAVLNIKSNSTNSLIWSAISFAISFAIIRLIGRVKSS
jgi:fluoride ion exporter CrcB/FEX